MQLHEGKPFQSKRLTLNMGWGMIIPRFTIEYSMTVATQQDDKGIKQ